MLVHRAGPKTCVLGKPPLAVPSAQESGQLVGVIEQTTAAALILEDRDENINARYTPIENPIHQILSESICGRVLKKSVVYKSS